MRVLAVYLSGIQVTPVLFSTAKNLDRAVKGYFLRQTCSIHLSTTEFSINFNGFSDQRCLLNFRFTKKYVMKMVKVVT